MKSKAPVDNCQCETCNRARAERRAAADAHLPTIDAALVPSEARKALALLLSTRGCWTNDQPETPDEISAQFDITLDLARRIVFLAQGEPLAQDPNHEVAAASVSAEGEIKS